MRWVFLLTLLLCLAFLGCTRDFYQPRPPLFQTWTKKGASNDESKKALLICGYDNPYTGYDVQKMRNDPNTLENGLRADICMEKSGFKSVYVDEGKSLCQVSPWSKLKECK